MKMLNLIEIQEDSISKYEVCIFLSMKIIINLRQSVHKNNKVL